MKNRVCYFIAGSSCGRIAIVVSSLLERIVIVAGSLIEVQLPIRSVESSIVIGLPLQQAYHAYFPAVEV